MDAARKMRLLKYVLEYCNWVREWVLGVWREGQFNPTCGNVCT